MKKIVFNRVVLDINGEPITNANSLNLLQRQALPQLKDNAQVAAMMQKMKTPITFGSIVLPNLLNAKTNNDEEAIMLFNLAKVIRDSLATNAETVSEVSDELFDLISKIMKNQNVTVKVRFKEMIDELNAPA
ncbi:MAG: hypothetical protein J6V13_03840 [Paludibacteraceae bacterium]|nr:hypothetical protein [Paludibacteraceae bacterium]